MTEAMDFEGEWYGWRLLGRHLVSPDGDRMTPERLRGLVWRDRMELRLAGYASRRRAESAARSAKYGPKIKVVLIDLGDFRIRNRAAG